MTHFIGSAMLTCDICEMKQTFREVVLDAKSQVQAKGNRNHHSSKYSGNGNCTDANLFIENSLAALVRYMKHEVHGHENTSITECHKT